MKTNINYLMVAFLLLIVNNYAFCQKNITDYLKSIDFKLADYNKSDLQVTDTTTNLKDNYYAAFFQTNEDTLTLCSVKIFSNKDHSAIIGVTGYEADMQCGFYSSLFYVYSEKNDTVFLLDNTAVLPTLGLTDFLSDSITIKILEKYLPEIKEKEMGANATIDDVLKNIYDIHYIMPVKGTTVIATLNVCDYLLSNVILFEADEWKIIETDFKQIQLIYKNDIRKFEIKK
jgi:hypothetical protein